MQTGLKKPKNLPAKPGVYFFKDASENILYIGKAKNLRARVSQYFGNSETRPQIPFLMAEAKHLDYTVVTNELESLYLERNLIQQHLPKYNIELRDDKNYAFITMDFNSEIPALGYVRKFDANKKNILYFGPYTAAGKIRETLNIARKIFSYCSANKVTSKPCFYYHLHRCPGVCIGKISILEYKTHLEKIVKFLKGDIASIAKDIRIEMLQSAKQQRFETASKLRDQLRALQILEAKQNIIFQKKIDLDLVSLAEQSGSIGINLFKVRAGKMLDKENFIYSATKTVPDQTVNYFLKTDILQTFLEEYYMETSSAPKNIYIEQNVPNPDLVVNIISTRFHHGAKLETPKQGRLKKIITLGKLNAQEFLKNRLNESATNQDRIRTALNQLKQTLNLPSIPNRIECFDISNIQGTNSVGSMVVFANGLPAKSEYRKFKIQSKNTPDDFAMMKEMLSRRLNRIMNQESSARHQTEPQAMAGGQTKGKDTWGKPDLIVIDGGKGQLNAALVAMRISNSKFIISKQGSNLKSQIPIMGLAKRIEEIFLPNKKQPIILNHDQPALQLLQRLRDEAHRFGITFHRNLRSKVATKSALDNIPGIGPKTKKLLKQKLGTISEIRKADLNTLTLLVGKKLASLIKQTL